MNWKLLLSASLFSVITLSADAGLNGGAFLPAAKQQTAPQQSKKPEQKKKKCWFSRKKQKKEAQEPAAKDVLKDRNTKDPKIDQGPKPNTKANPAAIKDAKK
ncbi:hypothetical protein [Niabella drilacis]|uniref:Uncharacterized protein n=1 Tax=Niabella drilacis (strain DSM 25811 / CCM 8410 / CCUG 62505 / LMG 26954 / E90) TaxID=1285928 RepID=A0A1G6WHY7_NIADE|nr:hypothetical protein [Niabella drilacis]SDD65431.1 hypothetical protein SAMN04487894_111136 [Niabella drilacis]